jgi:hypothetical protein
MYSGDQNEWESGAPRRILGMKTWQAALLLIMALMDCLVIVVGTAIVLGPRIASGGGGGLTNLLPASTPPAAGPTLTPAPSITPITMVFQFPTFTPYGTPAESPTPTPADWMEGWTKISVAEVEMWVPGSYAAGDPHTGAEAIIASLQDMGADYNWDYLLEQMTTAEDNYVLWGIDSRQGNPAIVTNVAIIYDDPRSGESLADYVTRFIDETVDTFTLIDRVPFAHPLYEAERMVLEANDPEGGPLLYVLYSIGDGELVWNILCVTAKDEIEDRLPTFDQMVGSFRVLAAPQ